MIRLNGLTGGLVGTALAALGFVASAVLVPPRPLQPPVTAPFETDAAAALDAAPEDAALPMTERAAAPEPLAPLATPDSTPIEDTPAATAPDAPLAPLPDLPQIADDLAPDSPAALAEAKPPSLPEPFLRATPGGLPGTPVPPRGAPLPQSPQPPAQAAPEGEPADTAADDEDPQIRAEEVSPAPSLPGTRAAGLPGTPASPEQSQDAIETTEATDQPMTALERNSSFDGLLTGGPLMAIILNDPGLPTPLRRALAAVDLPITIALNPMDTSASQGADIYREAGKEVLILANGLPNGARATDLDVTFSAWFDSLPQAVGVLDLPRGGFARNAALTAGVLPLIARDGHGLVSFSGGLSRVDAAAQTAGVPHAEVFRVLDDEDQSAFTIRRYLDRAVFQASQIGQVLVFGDAANDATMEALELWRSDGRADQVSVVPVSTILLTR
jgi:uncharacterized protein